MIDCIVFIPFCSYKVTYTIGVLLFVITYGGQLGSFPLICDEIYGNTGALTYTFLFYGFNISSILSMTMYGL